MAIDETSVRIHLPQHLLERVRAYQMEHSITSFSAAVIQVLEQFFTPSSDAPTYAPLDRLEALEKEVQSLSYQLAQLNRQMIAQSMPPQLWSQPPSPESLRNSYGMAQPLTYEDIEDEPDEILWDFMPPEGKP
ncbi:hypothetical protein H6G89_09200 [Oscillatoria sp. FACHB-1407]|nr:hypothetical protein [Oscillatoria sp. FACHB-1407]MBD2461220.1 hypothetical protein [Oscillatoria sp. FACHB-1407]